MNTETFQTLTEREAAEHEAAEAKQRQAAQEAAQAEAVREHERRVAFWDKWKRDGQTNRAFAELRDEERIRVNECNALTVEIGKLETQHAEALELPAKEKADFDAKLAGAETAFAAAASFEDARDRVLDLLTLREQSRLRPAREKMLLQRATEINATITKKKAELKSLSSHLEKLQKELRRVWPQS